MPANVINQSMWLEQDSPPIAGQPDPVAGGPPQTQPGGPGDPMGQKGPHLGPTDMAVDRQPGEDVSDDPQFPDMPEGGEDQDFHVWKIEYVKASIKGDPNELLQKLLSVRNRELEPVERKFVEDNMEVQFLRQNSNIFAASKEIRSRIKKDFDRTNPGVTLTRHFTEVLQEQPLLNEVYIKLLGLGGAKGDLHRKFVASLLGAVQVGSGGQNEDLVFEEQDYSIRLSTRFNARWGDVTVGYYSLKEDDPERYLKPAELDRLQGGSPEEKDVLRRRVIIESIAEAYKERAFVVNVVGTDGTVYHLGWDLGNSLKAAYLDGKLVVRTADDDERQAFLDEEGSIIPIPKMSVYYVKEGQDVGVKGKPEIEEIEFMRHENGVLYLAAQLDLIKEASQTLQGMSYRESLWQGNPSDILKVMRCVPSAAECLLRQC